MENGCENSSYPELSKIQNMRKELSLFTIQNLTTLYSSTHVIGMLNQPANLSTNTQTEMSSNNMEIT